jgi:hypothetical protein
MGWNWRKNINIGPARINLSKGGVGHSFGFRGFRLGRNANGQNYTQTSIPKTGIYKREYHGAASRGIRWSLPVIVVVVLLLALLAFIRR